MKKERIVKIVIYSVCILLTVAAFYAKDFIFFDFHMEVSDYAYMKADGEKPGQADSSVWFAYGSGGKELQYGISDQVREEDIKLYALTADGAKETSQADMKPMQREFMGNFIAAVPKQQIDMDGDGNVETVYDFARADIGVMAFNPAPQRFGVSEVPFELVFAERKYILVYYQNKLLTEGNVEITSSDGEKRGYSIDGNGRISGLPIRDIRNGFTATYKADEKSVYRMYFALEDYPYFSEHFFKAHLPILAVLIFTAVGIMLCLFIRWWINRKNPDYAVYARRSQKNQLQQKTESKFLLVRWLFLIAGMFFWTYAGKLVMQGQALNEVAIPVFSCPFNLDQVTEVPCYYLSHLPALFTRFGPEFPARNLFYGVVFLLTMLFCFIFLGRILCGFLCPAGLLQDLMDKLRSALHIRPITVTDRMNRILQPVKWIWIILFLGFAFTGRDFCDICPLKAFATAQGGFWTNLYLGGFLTVIILVGSFFIKRFWCLICPMGYLMGIFRKFNLFHLKKDCMACTECGACYEACPMRIKEIYTEREKENVQTIDCMMCGECIHKCPEDHALTMTFCGKKIYSSSRQGFLSKYAPKKGKHKKSANTQERRQQ